MVVPNVVTNTTIASAVWNAMAGEVNDVVDLAADHDALINRLAADSGWAACSISSGYGGNLSVRRRGGEIWVVGNVARTGANVSGAAGTIGAMPSAAVIAPTLTITLPGYVTSPAGVCRVIINTDGTIDVSAQRLRARRHRRRHRRRPRRRR